MLVGLHGYAGSGKDTVANILIEKYGYRRMAFADKLKEFTVALNPIIHLSDNLNDDITLDDVLQNYSSFEEAKRDDPSIRVELQNIGTACRKVFGKDFWVNLVLPPDSSFRQFETVVIPDVRYANEVDAVHDMCGVVIRVSRPGYGPVNDHVSERELDCDLTIENNGSLEDLVKNVSLAYSQFL